ncbi:hypothetical protein HN682_10090 [Candidatus Peregrinibacteria bacterium]|nr:hypothetical protein [Candidatus Peregrinibacteria bacterium]
MFSKNGVTGGHRTLQIVCCLKSGGDFCWDYVDKLHENLLEKLHHSFEFTVFTDKTDRFSLNGINIQPLETDLESYWSKLEVFRMTGQVVYFDLDVILMQGLDELFRAVEFSPCRTNANNHFYMMNAFNASHPFNSSIMAWSGDFSYLLNNVNQNVLDRYGKWDQDYISDEVSKTNEILSVNDFINVASYKHHCKDGVDDMVDIVVFHGHPRPRDVHWLQGELVSR